MSTRANVILKDSHDQLIFYRHSDGYPEVTGKSLLEFVAGYAKHLRNNVEQSAGWLIVQGREEYSDSAGMPGYDWKVGAYEPAARLASDIEYLYIIDLELGTLSCREPISTFWKFPDVGNTKACAEFPTHKFRIVF